MKIGYARISTRDQSINLQVDALKEAGCEMIYQEIASGGFKTKRPVLEDLMKHLREGDTLIIWKFDRLARSLGHFVKTLDFLRENKINFLSLTEKIDTSTHTGIFIAQLIGALAELERSNIVERVKAGLAAARARGRVGGKKKGLSQKSIEKARLAEILYASKDISVSAIIKQLNISKPTFYNYLRYRGVEVDSPPFKRVVTVKQSAEAA